MLFYSVMGLPRSSTSYTSAVDSKQSRHIKRFLIGCRKQFAFTLVYQTKLRDWLRKNSHYALKRLKVNNFLNRKKSRLYHPRFPAHGAVYMYLLNPDWFIALFASAVVGQSFYFYFCLTNQMKTALNQSATKPKSACTCYPLVEFIALLVFALVDQVCLQSKFKG